MYIEVTDDEDNDDDDMNTITHASQHSGSEWVPTPALEGPPDDLDSPGDDPNNESDIFGDIPTSDPSDEEGVNLGVIFTNLAKEIDSLAKASHHTLSKST